MQAGDLLIFNTLLAHGIRPNQTTDRVRMAQYISMYPAEERNPVKRERASARGWSASIRAGTRSRAIPVNGKRVAIHGRN